MESACDEKKQLEPRKDILDQKSFWVKSEETFESL